MPSQGCWHGASPRKGLYHQQREEGSNPSCFHWQGCHLGANSMLHAPPPSEPHILRPSQGRRLLRGGRELATVLAAAACLPAWQLSQSPTPSGAGGVWRREQVEFSSPLQNDQVRALQCARIQFQDRNFYPLLSPLICGLCKGLEPIVCTLETKEPLAIGPIAREKQQRMYVFFLGSNTEPRILMNNS